MSQSELKYPVFCPYLCVRDGTKAIEFYKTALGAVERFRLVNKANGSVVHAELQIADAVVMLSDENPEWGNKSPQSLGGSPVTFCLTVENTDAAVARAVAAGAVVLMPPADQFYGCRSASIADPFGHLWMLQHTIEVVSPEDMQKRWDAMCAGA